MPSRPFDKLPDEVLLHIFVKGVEDQTYDSSNGGFSRRLKPFAGSARQVCAQWKTIIDNPPSGVSFWVAMIILRPGMLSDRTSDEAFAKQLATLRCQLLSSKGCDLTIMFALSYLIEEMAADRLSPYASAITRLVIYAMDMIVPFHSQVVGLRLFAYSSDISIHLMKLIAIRWNNMLQLAEVVMEGILRGSDTKAWLDILPGIKGLLSETSIRASWQLSLSHLRSLDTLIIPARLCLDEGLRLPPNLQSLTLFVSQDALPKLFNFLRTEQKSLERLLSIGISKTGVAEVMSTVQSDGQDQAKHLTRGRINLPLLRRVTLERFFAHDMQDFLGLFHCRYLEDLSLDFLTGGKEVDKESLLYDLSSEFPRLTVLKIWNIKSWRSIYYLEALASLPIQRLSVSFEQCKPEWISHLDAFRISLSKLHLQDFTLEGPSWVVRHILDSVDTQNLIMLKAALTTPEADSEEGFAPIDPMELLASTQNIVAPQLRELSFEGSEEEFIHLLSRLEAAQLDTIDVTFLEGDSPEGREKISGVLSTKSFASVRVLDLRSTLVDDPPLWHLHLFPNLHELQIRVKKSTDDDLIPYLIGGVMQPLCDTLTSMPFPRLHSIRAECNVFRDRSQQIPQWSDGARVDVDRMVQAMLARRAKVGGLVLQVEPIQFDFEYDLGDGYMTAIVNFEAHAAHSSSL